MSDARDPSAIAVATTAATSSPGAWLKQERERQSITTQRIAADMHLSVGAIDAIETDRFAVLGAPVFAKGHLRKYASLLRLPADRVIELYDQLEGAPSQVDPIPLTQRAPEPALRPGIREMLGAGSDGRPHSASIMMWTAVGAILTAVLVGGAWWYLGHRTDAAPVLPTASSPVTEESAMHVAPEAADSEAQPRPAAQQASPLPTAEAQSVPSPPPRTARPAGTPPPGKVRIRLTFARESWVEVYDAAGNRMLYDVGRVDLPRLLDVEPPALVVLGDASAVTTEANDQVVAVPSKNISGTVARFSVAADGSVR